MRSENVNVNGISNILELNRDKNSIAGRLKDWSIQNIRYNSCYAEDWDCIKDILNELEIEYKEHGPIITINERKNIELTYQLMNEALDIPELYRIASYGVDTSLERKEYENKVRSNMFLCILRLLPEFCRDVAVDKFRKLLSEKVSHKYFSEFFSIHGFIKDTDEKVDSLVLEMSKGIDD